MILRAWVGNAWRWLVVQWNWPAAGLVAAAVLFAITPVFWMAGGLPLLLVALQWPVYMLHQAEEHLGDRFRLDINRMAGCEALSRTATFWINFLGVWVFEAVALTLALFVSPAWGLFAGYLAAFNGLTHIVVALVKRRANPGLVTSVLLLLPLGVAAILALRGEMQVHPAMHEAAIAIVLAEHAMIVGWVGLRRKQSLARAAHASARP